MNLYLAANADNKTLSAEEKLVCKQFAVASTFEKAVQNTPLNYLKMFNMFLNLIEHKHINIYSPVEHNPSEETSVVNTSDKGVGPSSVGSPVLSSVPSVTDFDYMYKKASAAYVGRHYEKSLKLFKLCYKINPEDTRVRHNIRKIAERLRKS